MKKLKIFISNNWPLIFVSLIYLFLILLMLPLRNGPFDDDFAYIKTATLLTQTGHLKIHEWSAISLVSQAIWGSLFQTIFGLNIKSLHLANIILFYFGILAFYVSLQALELSKIRAFIFSIVYIVFPWHFFFIFTFMSDTFYLSFLMIALSFFLLGLKNNKRRYLFFGSLFSGIAFLTRQTGFIPLIAFLVLLVYKSLSDKKISFKQVYFGILPGLAVILVYELWLRNTGLTTNQNFTTGQNFQQNLQSYLPTRLGRLGTQNNLYIEILFQRLAGYSNVIISTLSLIFLFFKFNLQKVIGFLKNNKLTTLFGVVVLIFIYLIDALYKSKFTSYAPSRSIFGYLLVDWKSIWPFIFYISLPVWGIFWGVVIKRFVISLFDFPRSLIHRKIIIFKKIIYFFPAAILIFFLLIIRDSYPYVFKAQNTEEKKIPQVLLLTRGYVQTFSKQNAILGIFKETWCVYLIFSLFFVLALCFILFLRIKPYKKINSLVLFVVLTFLGHFFLVMFLGYFYWDEYIIAFSPFLIILMAYVSRKTEFSVVGATLAILLMSIVTIQVTRNRYQEQGTRWELGAKLVEMKNIPPIDYEEPGWAWKPWWYFDYAYAKALDKAGGDKYKVTDLSSYWNEVQERGQTYKTVESNQLAFANKNSVLASGWYWVFSLRNFPIEYKQIIVIKE